MNKKDGSDACCLSEWVDIDRLQGVFERFSMATTCSVELYSFPNREPQLRCAGHRNVCANFHQAYPSSNKNCANSMKQLLAQLETSSGVVVLVCGNGLAESGLAITLDGEHVADLIMGQVFLSPPDLAEFSERAEAHAYDEEAYLSAIQEVPVFTKAQIENFLLTLAEMVSMLIEQGRASRHFRELGNELQQSQNRLESLIETLPDMVWLKDPDGAYLACNPRLELFFGTQRSEIIGKTDYDFMERDLANLSHTNHKAAIAAGAPRTTEREVVFVSDGHRELLETIETPMFDDDGTLIGVLGTARDITLRRRAEEELRESEGKYRNLFENSPIGVAFHRMIYDETGKPVDFLYLDANKNFQAFTGADPTGKRVTEVFPGIEKDPEFDWIGTCARAARDGETVRFQQYLAPVDRWYDIIAFQNKPDHFVVSFLEITDQKRTEEALRQSEENLHITLDSIGDAVIATNAEGVVTRMNPVAEALTGWSFEDAEGKELSQVFNILDSETREPVHSPAEKVLQTNDAFQLPRSTILVDKTGEERMIADSGAAIRNDDNDLVGVVLVFRDVTEEMRIQEQLNQSRKMDAIGQLAGGIAHDFNNMLGAIVGAAELLGMSLSGNQQTKPYLDMILTSADRASGLATKLLAFGRKHTSTFTTVDIHRIITDTAAILKNTIDRRINVELKLDAEVSLVFGESSQLQSTLLNLGINASHAMPSGGSLLFKTRVADLDKDYCENSSFDLSPGRHIDVTVHDTGEGIPPENLDKIFEPFFTTKEQGKGTGLGLAASYGTIRQHNGAISVYSELGMGTTFHITLPLSDASACKSQELETIHHGSGTILVVDDEPILRATAEAHLSAAGYNVILAEDGEDAVNCYLEHRDVVDLVICDMIMPKMNGRDCFLKMREIDPEVRFVLASGFALDSDASAMHQEGLDGFIQKPFRGTELSRVVAEALGRPSG